MGSPRRSRGAPSVLEQIKQYIVDHALGPGDPLPSELVLCDELGVSRSSIREAIRQLDGLDIVDVQHGRGTFVGAISLAPLVDSVTFRCLVDPRGGVEVLREIVDVRRSLDAGQARAVVGAMAGETHASLHELADTMIARSEQGEDFAEEDARFHTRLLDLTIGNVLAGNLIGAFWDIHTHVLRQLDVPRPEEIADTAHAHRAMLLAAESGDVEAYRDAVDAHYEPLLRVLDRVSPSTTPERDRAAGTEPERTGTRPGRQEENHD